MAKKRTKRARTRWPIHVAEEIHARVTAIAAQYPKQTMGEVVADAVRAYKKGRKHAPRV